LSNFCSGFRNSESSLCYSSVLNQESARNKSGL
jgi:hypothetical protein